MHCSCARSLSVANRALARIPSRRRAHDEQVSEAKRLRALEEENSRPIEPGQSPHPEGSARAKRQQSSLRISPPSPR